MSLNALLAIGDQCRWNTSYSQESRHYVFEVRYSGNFVRFDIPTTLFRGDNLKGSFSVSAGVQRATASVDPYTGRGRVNIFLNPNSNTERVDARFTTTEFYGVHRDCTYDERDLEAIYFAFGLEVGTLCPNGRSRHVADLNGDGRVDDADILFVLLNWGQKACVEIDLPFPVSLFLRRQSSPTSRTNARRT